MEQLEQDLRADVENIGKIEIVPKILDVICQITGMGFGAVARVTEDKWIACYVRDDISFGLKPGGELQVDTTICDEIRASRQAVIINHVNEDEHFRNHHTPLQYGFQSYISVPIIKKDNTFFGTLCAIDPNPHELNTPEIFGMFTLFADLISFHLDVIEQLETSSFSLEEQKVFNNKLEIKIKERTAELENKNEEFIKKNKELQEFNYISSHDLQEPLRKIQTFVSRIQETESASLSENGSFYFKKIRESAERMQLLINDLLSYSATEKNLKKIEHINLQTIVLEVLEDLHEEILEKSVKVEHSVDCFVNVIPFQFRQLFYNLIGNAIKYSSTKRNPVISINSEMLTNTGQYDFLLPNSNYCHISIIDNGIGFSSEYEERIFELFQRLHNKTEYSGTGIGLAIVKKIIENHHGQIIAKGIPDQGAEFHIFLPSGE